MKPYYEVLGVERHATYEAIRKAWRSRAQECHPDKFSSARRKEEAHERFVELAEAFRVLGDEKERRDYDRSLSPVPIDEKMYRDYSDEKFRSDWADLVELYEDIWKESTGKFMVNTARSGLAVLLVGLPWILGTFWALNQYFTGSGEQFPWIFPLFLFGSLRSRVGRRAGEGEGHRG
jgi:curved DNA-binding protein CbpA